MREVETLVPTREICQKLKAAGFPQDTVFKWCRLTRKSDVKEGAREYSVSEDSEDYYVPAEEVCASPTAEEILKELPTVYDTSAFLDAVRMPGLGWRVGWKDEIQREAIPTPTLVDAAALTYLEWRKGA